MKRGHFIRFIPTLLFLLLLVVFIFSITKANITKGKNVVSGQVTLDEQKLETSVYALNGTWEFYPYALSPDECSTPYFITVPQSWKNDVDYLHIIEGKGYGTYHARIYLPSPGLYSLYISSISCAYDLYLNETKMVSNGVVGTSKSSEVCSGNKQILFFEEDTEIIDIYISVSNYHLSSGGIVKSLYFGYPSMINQVQMQNIIINALYLGILLAISFYIIIFNRSLHRKTASLYLGLFGFSTMMFQSIMDDSVLIYLYPKISILFINRLEYMIYVINVLAYLGYIYHMFPCRRFQKPFRTFLVLDCIYCVLIDTPLVTWVTNDIIFIPIIAIHILFVFLLLYQGLKQKRRYVILIIISMVDMVFCITLELLISRNLLLNELWMSHNIFVLGELIFLLFQSYVVAADMEETFLNAQQAADMEVAFLQAQISPHFFFNVLNNIYYLLDTNPPMAKDLLIQFNQYLRVKHKFDFRHSVFYTLKEELDFVRSYINIERVRLDNQVQLVCDVSDSLLDLQVPPLILQPLVENSIKHGFHSTLLTIHITVSQCKNYANFEISDNGKGMGFDLIQKIMLSNEEIFGIGIKNINYRLNKCYHEQLSIKSTLGEGTTISFHIPLEVSYENNNH